MPKTTKTARGEYLDQKRKARAALKLALKIINAEIDEATPNNASDAPLEPINWMDAGSAHHAYDLTEQALLAHRCQSSDEYGVSFHEDPNSKVMIASILKKK